MRMGLVLFLPGKHELLRDEDPAVVDLILRVERALIGDADVCLRELATDLHALPAALRKTPAARTLLAWLYGEQGQTALAASMFDQLRTHWRAELQGPFADTARRWLVNDAAYQGQVYTAMGRHDLSQQAFAEARAHLAPLMPPAGPTRMLQVEATEAERLAGMDPSGYTGLLSDALRFFDHSGEITGVARAANNLGHVYLELGEASLARSWLEHSVELLQETTGNIQLPYALDSLGICYQQLGLVEEARQVLHDALRRATQLGAAFLQVSILTTIGSLHRDSGEPGLATELYQKASELAEHLRDTEGIVRLALERSTLYRRADHLGLALEAATEAEKLTHRQRDRTLVHLLACKVLLNRPEAPEELESVAQRLRRQFARREESLALWYMAVAAQRAGRKSNALRHVREALSLAAQHRQLYLLALELPVTARVLQPVVEQGLCPEALAGLVQRATSAGLAALLEAVPASAPILAAAGRLGEARTLSFRLMGLFQVARSGRTIDLASARSQKAVSLLKYLAGHRGRAVPREQIVEAVWPEADPAAADRSFEVTLSTLRRLLEPEDGPSVIIRRGRGYLLNPEIQVSVDTDQFNYHIERGNWWWAQGQAAAAESEWRAAESLYGGDLLAEDPYEDWAIADRERLREQYLDLLLRLGELALRVQRPHEAVVRANRVLAEDPIRESAYRLLMRAHLQMGDRAVALRDYRRCSRALKDELGAEPAGETQELAHRIRSGRL